MLNYTHQDEFVYICVAVMSLWSGLVYYLLNVKEGTVKSNFAIFLCQVFVSSFSAVLGGLISIEYEMSLSMTLCATGVSGSLGIELLKILQRKLLNLIDNKK
jgi:hypothetical protein